MLPGELRKKVRGEFVLHVHSIDVDKKTRGFVELCRWRRKLDIGARSERQQAELLRRCLLDAEEPGFVAGRLGVPGDVAARCYLHNKVAENSRQGRARLSFDGDGRCSAGCRRMRRCGCSA